MFFPQNKGSKIVNASHFLTERMFTNPCVHFIWETWHASTYFPSIVKGEPGEEDVREGLNNAEKAINNPVGEPLGVVVLVGALNGLDAEKTGGK